MYYKKLRGFIIGNKPYQEWDRLISFFSYEEGIVPVFAKGARRITSHRSFHLDLLNYLSIEIESSAHAISGPYYLREASSLSVFSAIKKHPLRFGVASLIAGFLSRNVPPHASQKKLFRLTHQTLSALDAAADFSTANEVGAQNAHQDPKQILFLYLVKSLRLLGYMPDQMARSKMRGHLRDTLYTIDPELTREARRTLGMFSSFENSASA